MGYLPVILTVLPLATWVPAAGDWAVIGSRAPAGLAAGDGLSPASVSVWMAFIQLLPTTGGTVTFPPPPPGPWTMPGGLFPGPATGGEPAMAIAWSISDTW